MEVQLDETNSVSGQADAEAFGELLEHDISPTGISQRFATTQAMHFQTRFHSQLESMRPCAMRLHFGEVATKDGTIGMEQ